MSFRPGVMVHDGLLYSVTSYGNGAAYAIVRKSDNASIFLQDDACLPIHQDLKAGRDWDDIGSDYCDEMRVNIHSRED